MREFMGLFKQSKKRDFYALDHRGGSAREMVDFFRATMALFRKYAIQINYS